MVTKGLDVGKVIIHSTAHDSTDHILWVYFIYNKDIDQDVTLKILSEKGEEYGRATQHIQGKQGDAGYTTFEFDPRTDIESRGTITVE